MNKFPMKVRAFLTLETTAFSTAIAAVLILLTTTPTLLMTMLFNSGAATVGRFPFVTAGGADGAKPGGGKAGGVTYGTTEREAGVGATGVAGLETGGGTVGEYEAPNVWLACGVTVDVAAALAASATL